MFIQTAFGPTRPSARPIIILPAHKRLFQEGLTLLSRSRRLAGRTKDCNNNSSFALYLIERVELEHTVDGRQRLRVEEARQRTNERIDGWTSRAEITLIISHLY